MRATTRKALRDLRRQRPQVVAVAVTVLLGVALFIASAGAFRNLQGSYRHTYERLRFADLTATGGDAAAVAQAVRAAGATAVTVRTQLDPPLLVDGTKLVGRVVGLPADARPTVDDVQVTRGRYLTPSAPRGVLVETHAATTFGLAPGDRLQVFTPDGWEVVTVRGVVVSAEYIWPARSRREVLGDPHDFAVLFAPERTVRAWAGGAANQVLVRLPGGYRGPHAVAVGAAARAAGATDVATQAEQASQATLQLDLDGFSQMSVAFPVLFLTAAAVAAYVLLARRVRAERPIIGALLAGGARRGRLVRHYLLQGLLIGLLGSSAGVVLGILATGAITAAYTSSLGIPDTLVSHHPRLWVVGLAFGVVVGLVGATAPALTAAGTAPAEAMRNETVSRPPGWWSHAVARLRGLPVAVRMALRDVFRSWRRTAATALGTVLSLILVLASVGMMTSITAALHLQYDQVQHQDATLTVDTGSARQVTTRLRALAAVTAVEKTPTGPVTVAANGSSYPTVLQGFRPGTTMHGFLATTGASIALPHNGLLAGRALADRLHVRVGDTVTLASGDGSPARTRIAGFVDEPLGTTLYARTDLASSLLPRSPTETILVRYAAGTDRDRMRRAVTALDGVLAYADARALLHSMDQYLGLFWAFVTVMVLLGSVLALAIIYVTMAVNVVERTNELATLRAAGVPVRRVAATLATENLAATVLGIPVGLLLGVVAAGRFLGLFSSDLFQLRLSLGWWTLLAAALGVLLAAAASQWPAARAVRRLDVARVVRERAG